MWTANEFITVPVLREVFSEGTSVKLEGYFMANEHLVTWLEKTLAEKNNFDEMKKELTELCYRQKFYNEEFKRIAYQ